MHNMRRCQASVMLSRPRVYQLRPFCIAPFFVSCCAGCGCAGFCAGLPAFGLLRFKRISLGVLVFGLPPILRSFLELPDRFHVNRTAPLRIMTYPDKIVQAGLPRTIEIVASTPQNSLLHRFILVIKPVSAAC